MTKQVKKNKVENEGDHGTEVEQIDGAKQTLSAMLTKENSLNYYVKITKLEYTSKQVLTE